MSYGIEVVNADRIRKRLRPSTINGPLKKVLTSSSLTAEVTAKARAPRWTGQLKRNIASEVHPLQSRVFTKKNLAYFAVQEHGRRPGAKMPPPSALAAWARSKGYGGSLFVLARAIARRGIKGRFFFKAGHDAAYRKMPSLLRRMGQEMGLNFGGRL